MSATSNWIRFFCIPLIASLFWIAGQSCHATDADATGLTPVSRKILALYDANVESTGKNTQIAENCQTILNYLGLVVDYRDVNQPFPGPGEMATYRGILTWFESEEIQSPGIYLTWLDQQLRGGQKLVVLGFPGIREENLTPELKPLAANLYAHLGLAHGGDDTHQRALLRYAKMDSDMLAFERDYPPIPLVYDGFFPIDDRVSVHLSLSRTDRSDADSAVVCTGPGGGMAWGPYALWQEGPPSYRRQWYIDPFAFFSQAFDLAVLPRPDPTTLNGRRIAFSHVDGDAFSGFTQVVKNAICADVIRERILKRYSFPVTVSVIVGEIDPGAKGNEELVAKAREIFALPNVEPASHSYSHPFYWDPDFDNTRANYPSQYGMKIPGYEFDPAMEIDYSVRYISENLVPPEKPCRVFLWSGNCEPLAEHIERCDNLGIFNMNGGDTLFDAVSNSYAAVAPLYGDVGGCFQYFTGQVNENILTNLWTGPFYGFRKVITTMDRTGSPRRIKPIDIYFHFYSGEYPTSLKALESVYDWVLTQPIAPMFTSDYIRIVKSWQECRLTGDPAGRQWTVENYGDCLTLRFDAAATIPDLENCENVLGYLDDPHGLFVHLAPEKEKARIALAPKGQPAPAAGLRPYLRQADGWVGDFRFTADGIRFSFKGFGSGIVELAGMTPGSRWQFVGDRAKASKTIPEVDARGILVLSNLTTGIVEIGRR
ncbi:hypothetical protein [Breoghania sp.]|uniref:polysaccharide deacetylase family protein n=1 Tax=Breoghania sp. TaxID=2065378 RepID=UPI0029C6895F|nr:hypothetical protein [Breoghania sp.]